MPPQVTRQVASLAQNSMNLGIIFLIVFAVIIVGVVIMVVKTMKKLDTSATGAGVKQSAMKTAHDFLPFAAIENDVMDLGGSQYRMIIEVSSTNYLLKNEQEQEIVELSFRNFLNSIDYPFSMFIQTREIDLNAIINNLKKDINETCKTFPGLREYGEAYYEYITGLKERTGCTKQKRKFIIIPYDEGIKMPDLDEKARRSYSYEQIYERAMQVIEGLSSIGLRANILTTNQIVELFYSLTHRSDDTIVDYIADGSYMSEYIKSRTRTGQKDKIDDAIQIIHEAENRFNVNIITADLTPGQIAALKMFTEKLASTKSELMKIKKAGGVSSLMSLEEQFEQGASGPAKN